MAIIRKHIDNIFSQKFSLLDHEMLDKYFTDESLNQETELIVKEKWEQFDPGTDTPPNLNHVYYKLYHTIHQKDKNVRSKDTSLFLRFSRIAAVLIIGILSVTSVYFYNKDVPRINDQQVEIISHNGFRNQFKLPDGTTGWLGHESTLKYHIVHNQRIVELDGLAFFDVVHQRKRPFIVKTPAKLDIEVLGTRFNVSSYSEENYSEIVLEEGRVKLNLPNRKIQNMLPNERIVYHSFDHSIDKSKVDAEDFLAWTDGRLILKDVTLNEACLKLSRFYNVEFDLQNQSQHQQKIRMTLKDDPLEDALKLLTIISPVTYHIEERKVLSDDSYSKRKIVIKHK